MDVIFQYTLQMNEMDASQKSVELCAPRQCMSIFIISLMKKRSLHSGRHFLIIFLLTVGEACNLVLNQGKNFPSNSFHSML